MAEAEVAQPPTVTEDIPKDEPQVANNVSPVTETPKVDGMVNGDDESKAGNDTAAENEVENGEKEESKKEETTVETGSPKAKKDKKPSKIANFLRKFSCTSGEPDENINPKSKPIDKNSDSKPKVNGEEKKKKDKKKNKEDNAAGEEKEEEGKDNVVSNDEVKVVITEAEEVKVNGEMNGEETEEMKEIPAEEVKEEAAEKVEEPPAVNGCSEDNEVTIIEEVVVVPNIEGLNMENKGAPEGTAVVAEPVVEHHAPPSEAPPPIPEGGAPDPATEKSTEKAAPTEGGVTAVENK